MYLLDSNIFLELLLEQEKAAEVEQFLRASPRERLHNVVAEKNNLEIISFDGDFDRTEKGRKTPDGAGIINKKAE